jgi:hypothetical protein
MVNIRLEKKTSADFESKLFFVTSYFYEELASLGKKCIILCIDYKIVRGVKLIFSIIYYLCAFS